MKQKSINDYEIIEKLGRGASGNVWKALVDGNYIALKEIYAPKGSKMFDVVKNEVEILERITKKGCHPNIVCYYDHYYDPDNNTVLIEMEYIDGDTLTEYLNKVKQGPKKSFLIRYLLLILKDLARGLSYIHENGLLHNDIKPDNILIDKNLTPKFVDFGLGCVTHDTCRLGNHKYKCCGGYIIGTPAYSPPEIFDNEHDGKRYPQSDVWSLGVSIYEGANGKLPFDYNIKSIRDTMEKILEEEPKPLMENPQTLDEKVLTNLVKFMLEKNPAYRMTAFELSRDIESVFDI